MKYYAEDRTANVQLIYVCILTLCDCPRKKCDFWTFTVSCMTWSAFRSKVHTKSTVPILMSVFGVNFPQGV